MWAEQIEARCRNKNSTKVNTNSDFLILPDNERFCDIYNRKIDTMDIDSVGYLTLQWESLIGRCAYSDILGILSIKSGCRPDRTACFNREAMHKLLLREMSRFDEDRRRSTGSRFFVITGNLSSLNAYLETISYKHPEPAVNAATEVHTLSGKAIRRIMSDVRGRGRRKYEGLFREQSGKIAAVLMPSG